MISRLLHYLASILIILALIGFVKLNDRPSIRYYEYPSHYEFIWGQAGNVDLALIGTSRTMRAVWAPVLAEEMKNSLGREPIVYDLSRSGQGPGVEYVILRDLLASRQIARIACEYKQPQVNQVHTDFFRLARIQDLLGELPVMKGPYPEKARQAFRQVGLKLGDGLRILLSDTSGLTPVAAPEPARTSDASQPYFIRIDYIARVRKQREKGWRKRTPVTWNLDRPGLARAHYYTKKIIKTARDHGAEVTFFFVPQAYGPCISEKTTADFERRFGARIVQPPLSVRAEMNNGGYADLNHVNDKGMRSFGRWLAGVL